MTDNAHTEPTTRERKRAAVAKYDAWVESDLRSTRKRNLSRIGVGVAIAATVVIGATQVWQRTAPDDALIDPATSPATLSSMLGSDWDAFDKELRKLPLPKHVQLVRVAQSALEDRLLIGPARWWMRLLGDADGGICRILNRGQSGLVSLPGGGAYFSFTSRSNSYDKEPDLELQGWAFRSGFAGGDVGVVVKLDRPSVDVVTLSALPQLLRAESATAFERAARARSVKAPEAVVGGVYAVRSVRWGKSDLIAAFEVLDRGEYGISFVWTLLETRPTPTRR